jgi:hypothetical protein
VRGYVWGGNICGGALAWWCVAVRRNGWTPPGVRGVGVGREELSRKRPSAGSIHAGAMCAKRMRFAHGSLGLPGIALIGADGCGEPRDESPNVKRRG